MANLNIPNRKWIGIDISHKAYELGQKRIESLDGVLSDDTDYNFQTVPPKRTDDGQSAQNQKYMYVITHPNYPQRRKVGIASNLKSRLSSYQTADLDRGYEIAYSVLTPHFRELEKHIHTIRENDGEWIYGNVEEIQADIEIYLASAKSKNLP